MVRIRPVRHLWDSSQIIIIRDARSRSKAPAFNVGTWQTALVNRFSLVVGADKDTKLMFTPSA